VNFKSALLGLFALLASSVIQAAPKKEFADSTHVTSPTRLWTEPTKFGEPIAELEVGLKLEVLQFSTTDSWIRVETPTGRQGWVPTRMTALSGRRDRPLLSSGGSATGGGRSPSSIAGASSSAQAGGHSDFGLALALGYENQLNRSAASGLGTGVSFVFASSDSFAWGLGFSYSYFFDKASDTTISREVTRKSSKFVPEFVGEYRSGDFLLGLGLGFEVDKTSLETIDTSSGRVLSTDESGNLLTGSDTSNGLLISLKPMFKLPIDGLSLRVGLGYKIGIDLSDGSGPFAAEAGSKLTHTLALGTQILFDL
jgi:hypothetical protein